MRPVVSVLLPAHNAERYLVEAMDSILAQTYRNFELLVVDDGSKDSTPLILKQMAKKDPRVRWWRLPRNRGRSYGLNFLVGKARGSLLARMDGDDVAIPERLALQVAELEADPGLGVLSCAMWLWDGGTRRRYSASPLTHGAIKATLAFHNCVSHPGLMMRRSALGALRYVVDFETEDYELWCRLILKARFKNMAEPLLDYRVHTTQSGSGRPMQQYLSAGEVRVSYLKRLGFKLKPAQVEFHGAVCLPFLQRRQEWMPGVRNHLMDLLRQNVGLKAFEQAELQQLCRERFAHYCLGLGTAGAAFYALQGGALRSGSAFTAANAKAFLKHHLKPEPDRWR